MPIVKARAKVGGITFSGYGMLGYKGTAFNGTAEKRLRDELTGAKMPLGSAVRNNKGRSAALGNYDQLRAGLKGADGKSKSPARKAASAMIAKIPLPLSRHIAAAWKPEASR